MNALDGAAMEVDTVVLSLHERPLVPNVTPHATVLILGSPGAGSESLARALLTVNTRLALSVLEQ